MTISELFEEEPSQWGLRGDQQLWRELKERFKAIPMPHSPGELKAMIEKEYEAATAHSIEHGEHFRIERLGNLGLSSGGISPRFWVEEAIPLLISRYPRETT